MPELSFSDFWRDASLGRLQEARGSDEHANVRMHELLRPSACRTFVEYVVALGHREVAPPPLIPGTRRPLTPQQFTYDRATACRCIPDRAIKRGSEAGCVSTPSFCPRSIHSSSPHFLLCPLNLSATTLTPTPPPLPARTTGVDF